MTLLSSK